MTQEKKWLEEKLWLDKMSEMDKSFKKVLSTALEDKRIYMLLDQDNCVKLPKNYFHTTFSITFVGTKEEILKYVLTGVWKDELIYYKSVQELLQNKQVSYSGGWASMRIAELPKKGKTDVRKYRLYY